MIRALHGFLALVSAVVMTLAGLEACRRALLKEQPGLLTARIAGIVLPPPGVTAASGLGMFLGGAQPHKELHFMYALLVLGALPVANALGSRKSPRRCALTTVVGVLFGLVLIIRLFMTG